MAFGRGTFHDFSSRLVRALMQPATLDATFPVDMGSTQGSYDSHEHSRKRCAGSCVLGVCFGRNSIARFSP